LRRRTTGVAGCLPQQQQQQALHFWNTNLLHPRIRSFSLFSSFAHWLSFYCAEKNRLPEQFYLLFLKIRSNTAKGSTHGATSQPS
jgi:hypothetical protein